jgi:hypothetical protein
MNIYRRESLSWFLSPCLLIAILLLFYLKQQSHPPILTPWPGTYQHFKETDFYSKTHKLLAVSYCDAWFALSRLLDSDKLRTTLKALLNAFLGQAASRRHTIAGVKISYWACQWIPPANASAEPSLKAIRLLIGNTEGANLSIEHSSLISLMSWRRPFGCVWIVSGIGFRLIYLNTAVLSPDCNRLAAVCAIVAHVLELITQARKADCIDVN